MKKFLEVLVGGTLVWAVGLMALGAMARVSWWFVQLGWSVI